MLVAGRDDAWRRLHDLADPGAEHVWLWTINKAHGFVMPTDEFMMAVRLRTGAPIAGEPLACGHCGKAMLDKWGGHGVRCVGAECTLGRNCIRDSLAAGFAAADPSTSMEAEGLVPS